jgi:hypothetical protein
MEFKAYHAPFLLLQKVYKKVYAFCNGNVLLLYLFKQGKCRHTSIQNK